jgi:CheY-like chemotaxis protein
MKKCDGKKCTRPHQSCEGSPNDRQQLLPSRRVAEPVCTPSIASRSLSKDKCVIVEDNMLNSKLLARFVSDAGLEPV